MFYRSIQDIIRHIRKTIACAHCGKSFNEKDVEILDIYASRLSVAVCCPHCMHYTTIVMSEEYSKPRSVDIREACIEKADKKQNSLSANEVLDMTTLLRNLKGSFKDVFHG